MKFLSHNLEIYTNNCTVHGTNIRNKLQLHQFTLYWKGVHRSLMNYLNILQN